MDKLLFLVANSQMTIKVHENNNNNKNDSIHYSVYSYVRNKMCTDANLD